MRTILSILPTLSREYDQHFKSFSNIPVKTPESDATDGGLKSSKVASNKSESQSSEDEESEDETSSANAEQASPPKDGDYPSTRGSRCFEILGFDVMIDANLKPWIIEVNHLPR